MLHSLPHDAVFADAIYSAKGSSKAAIASVEDASAFGGLGRADVQTYVFDSALPKIRCPHHGHGHDHAAAKEEMEKVTVKVYRYHILPGGRGPLQTRVEVQGVGVSFQGETCVPGHPSPMCADSLPVQTSPPPTAPSTSSTSSSCPPGTARAKACGPRSPPR